jgi:SAM-dependent methyltransferase
VEAVVARTLTCRACGDAGLSPVLSLGDTPLANALIDAADLDQPEAVYPLDVVRCRACSLVQLTLSVPPETLFHDYAYFSSFSDALVAHAKRHTDRVRVERRLDATSLVMEIASNDGYLLKHYVAAGVPVLGIEPAANIAQVAEAGGVRTQNVFFGKETAARLAAAGERADVVHANNVLAHVPDLTGFVDGLRTVLKPDGRVVIEAPYVRDLIEHCEFDTIYHEHLCYFSLTALDRLFRTQGLTVVDVERIAIHGGSLRVTAARSEAAVPPAASVAALLEDEAQWGVLTDRPYRDFTARVDTIRRDLAGFVDRARAEGGRVAAYGAAAKGATLLNCSGIGGDRIDFVVDRNTHKHGRYLPGAHIPVLPVSALVERMPAYTLLLSWNFADEILAQQAEYTRRGGRFVVPVPSVSVR